MGRGGCRSGSRRALALLLLLPVLLASGCAGLTGRRDVGSWFEARGADVMDVFGVRLGVGVGVGAFVRATEYAQLGFMVRGPSEATLVGASETSRSDSFRVRSVPCLELGTIGRYGGLWYDSTREVMLPGWSSRDAARSPIRREIIAGFVPVDGRLDDWRGEIGVGLHVFVFGFEAELRPFEVVDLLGGLVGYDPSGDDVPVAGSDGGPGGAAVGASPSS